MALQDKYINPFTDFGFKKLFGSEPNKDLNYDQESLKYYRDLKNVIDTSFEEGKEEGKVEGRAEGREEGKVESKMEIARQMKLEGEALEKIIRYTGLSEAEIEKL